MLSAAMNASATPHSFISITPAPRRSQPARLLAVRRVDAVLMSPSVLVEAAAGSRMKQATVSVCAKRSSLSLRVADEAHMVRFDAPCRVMATKKIVTMSASLRQTVVECIVHVCPLHTAFR